MKLLLSPLEAGRLSLKNRIVFPPVITVGWGAPDNSVTRRQLAHYGKMAAGGAGLVIAEASGVSRDAGYGRDVIGLWDDGFIPGLAELASAIRAGGARAGIQLYHPSKSLPDERECDRVAGEFVSAAARVFAAGFDCLELHAAHGFLLDTLCANGAHERVADVVARVRKVCGDMALGVRLGVSSPDPAAAVRTAERFIRAGADYINVSAGKEPFLRPDGYPYSALVYGASLVKEGLRAKAPDIPVFAVWGIREHGQAEAILESGIADAVCVGRAMLSDPEWANKASTGEKLNCCRECARCMWHKDGRRCPAQKFLRPELAAGGMDE